MTTPTSRATVYQTIRLGKETTAGTTVATTKKLKGITLTPSLNIPAKAVKNPGSKVATGVQVGQEFTEYSYAGALDFNLLTYIFSSIFGPVSPVVPSGGTLENDWIWTPSQDSPIANPTVYTIEHGSVKGAEKTGFSLFSDFGMTWNQTTADISGKMFGQRQTRNITPTVGATQLPTMVAPPALISAFVSPDGVTYTKLTSDLDGEMHFNGLWSPTFHVNDSNVSFDEVHERESDIGGTLTVQEGTDADTFLSNLRAGQLYYLGVKAVGASIETVTSVVQYHTLRINMPVYFNKSDPGDKNEVWGNTFTFEAGDDGVALASITLANKLAAL